MGSTRLKVPAVTLNGLHVGYRAYLYTTYKTGKKAGQEKVVVVDKIVKIEHDGKAVRVYRRVSGGWYGPEEASNIIDFDTIVTLEVPDGK